jgi:UDP:flavonoid glycosyltransferase YjiC (YdhE family)
MDPCCLFIINGLGLGNSTRCHAVMEHLVERGVRIHVLTSGNGLAYFGEKKDIASVTPMEAFFYSNKGERVSGWRTLTTLGALRRIARAKSAQLDRLLADIEPGVAVLDSEYAIRPLRKRRIPIIGLNNSEMVVSEYLRDQHPPRSIRSQFWCVEFPDYLFHKHFCDLVLSPSPRLAAPRNPRFKRVGLIVRNALFETMEKNARTGFPQPRNVRSVVFMLSGSILASHVSFSRRDFPFHVDVVGREGASNGPVTFHGRLMNNIDLLMKADVLVINGGFSAVSEAIALNKPTFVIPVPGHAEQYINAKMVRDLGRGFVADERDIMERIRNMVARNEWTDLKPRQPTAGVNGAREAADAIHALIDPRGYAALDRPESPGDMP